MRHDRHHDAARDWTIRLAQFGPVWVGRAMGKDTHTLECASEEADDPALRVANFKKKFGERISRKSLAPPEFHSN
jgi:hypothetical protein